MGIFPKYALIFLAWAGLFYLSYSMIQSKQEEMALEINRALTSSKEWNAYSSSQVLEADGKEEMSLQTILIQDPYMGWAKSKAKLTEKENFEFELYFQPEVIFLHSLNSGAWNKFDYTTPAAGEVEGIREPILVWQRLIKHMEKVEKLSETETTSLYRAKLRPFREQIHGITLEDIIDAEMEIAVRREPFGVESLTLQVESKPSITRLYDKISYSVKVSPLKEIPRLSLPEEAQTAVRLSP